jgi:hypothetical protein
MDGRLRKRARSSAPQQQGGGFSVRSILEDQMLKLLPPTTLTTHWDSVCKHCLTVGAQKEVKEGESLVVCSFCTNAYHDKMSCLGPKYFPKTKYETYWKGASEWVCPKCFERARRSSNESDSEGDEDYDQKKAVQEQKESGVRDEEEEMMDVVNKSKIQPVAANVSNEDCVQTREGETVSLPFGSVVPKHGDQFLFCIISKARPGNVAKMQTLFKGTGIYPTWVVGTGETEAYTKGGAQAVVEGGKLCASRNKAITIAQEAGKWCVQLSDDLSTVKYYHHPTDTPVLRTKASRKKWKKRNTSEGNHACKEAHFCRLNAVQAARMIGAQMEIEGAKLGGIYPNSNTGFAFGLPPTTSHQFIVGDFIVVDPSSSARFDETMTLKEDYDFTAQNLHKYGVVIRFNRIFLEVKHYTNDGGAVDVRTGESEQYNIRILRRKWPGVFQNQRRPNEVTMRWACLKKGFGTTLVRKLRPCTWKRQDQAALTWGGESTMCVHSTAYASAASATAAATPITTTTSTTATTATTATNATTLDASVTASAPAPAPASTAATTTAEDVERMPSP